MIIVQLTGGLGNQLFQYSSAKALSLHKDVPLHLDLSYFKETGKKTDLDYFQITDRPATDEELFPYYQRTVFNRAYQRLLPVTDRYIYKERFFHYDPEFLKIKDNVILKGLRQSEKFFAGHTKEIRDLLKIKNDPIKKVIAYKDEVNSKESISIHIRRGDYLTKKALHVLGLMEKEYYLAAYSVLSKKISNPNVYYFSDDIQWVQKELLPIIPGKLISLSQPTNHIEDFYLMSQCKHNIIANSSFSWWAAWVNDNPDKIVIAPQKWFNKGPKDTQDLIPEGWLRI